MVVAHHGFHVFWEHQNLYLQQFQLLQLLHHKPLLVFSYFLFIALLGW
jgi:hypothetical protein